MVPPQTKTTFDIDTYMAWEKTQAERHEYWAGDVFAMSGGTDAHYTITLNLAAALKSLLVGSPCRPFVSGMKVQMKAAEAVLYPDVFVTCDNRDKTPDANLVKAHPVLIAEALSDSIAAYDRSRKFELYQQMNFRNTCSLNRTRQHADLFQKNTEGLWVLHPTQPGDTIQLNSLNLNISLVTLYEDVDFNLAVG